MQWLIWQFQKDVESMIKYLTEGQVAQFQKNGVIVIPDFYRDEEINSIQRGIYDVIGQVMVKNGVPDTRT